MKIKKANVTCVSAAALLLGFSANATINLVQNGSFESPVTTSFSYVAPLNWSVTGAAGVWAPLTYPGAALAPADGNQIGFLNGGSMSQDVGAIQPDTRYNLLIRQQHRLHFSPQKRTALRAG